MKKFLFAIGLLTLCYVKPALATFGHEESHGQEKVCFCHNINHNPHTICTAKPALIHAHMRHVDGEVPGVQDSLGVCPNGPDVEEDSSDEEGEGDSEEGEIEMDDEPCEDEEGEDETPEEEPGDEQEEPADDGELPADDEVEVEEDSDEGEEDGEEETEEPADEEEEEETPQVEDGEVEDSPAEEETGKDSLEAAEDLELVDQFEFDGQVGAVGPNGVPLFFEGSGCSLAGASAGSAESFAWMLAMALPALASRRARNRRK